MSAALPNASAPKAPPNAKVSEVVTTFTPSRRFGPSANQKPYSVTSLDFDDTGELALVAQDDETLQIYNCKEGKHAKELKSQKYGVDIARFAHHPQSIIYASTKGDDAIRYLSSHDNSYIRYFRGHTAPVTCIALNPGSDEFVSTSLDNTFRVWDLRSSSTQCVLNLYGVHLAAYDPTASVVAIASPIAQTVLLYDTRQYTKNPFAEFDLRDAECSMIAGDPDESLPPKDWTKLEFSNDGRKVLLGTNGSGHYLLDAFHGNVTAYCEKTAGSTQRVSPSGYASLRERQQEQEKNKHEGGAALDAPVGASSTGDVCFSPDGRYLIGGSGRSGVLIWDTESAPGKGQEVELEDKTQLRLPPMYDLAADDTDGMNDVKMQEDGRRKDIAGAAAVVAYNPRHNLLVTADKSVVFWQPDLE